MSTGPVQVTLTENGNIVFQEKLAAEKHKIVVEVIVNQGYSRRDHHSEYLAMPPMGIIGPVEFVER